MTGATIPNTLGNYEKQVILELDNVLTLTEVKRLTYCKAIIKVFFCIITDFYDRSRTTSECAAAIQNLSKSIVITGSVPVRCNSE